jgi:branched-subunit amino acid ABC-type transport system permease component
MRAFLPFIVVGVTTGAVYALASMGLVLTYTTSGVFNFAHGAVGMFATFIFYELRVKAEVPTVLAVAVAVLVVAPAFGILIDRLLLARLAGAGSAAFVVVSLGLLVALQGAAIALFGAQTHQVDPLFPRRGFTVAGVNVGYDQAIVVAIAVAAGLGLAWFFRGTHFGLQTRAVVGDRDLTQLMGANARFITTVSWVLGCSFAALSGVLFAPAVGLDAVLLTLLVVQAFGAALIGRLRSMPLTNLGAYGIAIVAALSTKYVATVPSLIGLPSSLPFIALFLVLVVSPKGSFTEVNRDEGGQVPTAGIRDRFPFATVLVLLAVGMLVPVAVSGSRLVTATSTVAFVPIFVSLSLLVGLSRQLSLCHAVFVAFGATTLAHLVGAGVPFGLALFLAAAMLVPIGAAVAIPAIRLSGLFLALATFGFGILAQSLLFTTRFSFGRLGRVSVDRPSLFHGDTAYYYLVLGIAFLAVVAVELVRATRLGRVLQAVGDAPDAVESIGISPTASRVMAFCLAAFIAGIGGGLLGALVGTVVPTSFDAFYSLIWVTVLVAAGVSTLGGSILASLLLVTVPAVFTASSVSEWQPVAFGVGAILLAQAPNGIIGYLRVPDFGALARQHRWRLDCRRSAERRERVVLGRPTARSA